MLAPWCSDAEDILVADGPGVDHQRPRNPLTSTVSKRTGRLDQGWHMLCCACGAAGSCRHVLDSVGGGRVRRSGFAPTRRPGQSAISSTWHSPITRWPEGNPSSVRT